MSSELDSIVKGAPLPGRDTTEEPSANTTSGVQHQHQHQHQHQQQHQQGGSGPRDPLNHTPSSPSMIYLNLLILEASLRAQYLELRARWRHHTFFLLLLSAWVLGFGYALFLAPREDGRGMGGSVYWAVEATEKICFMGGIITALLVWATGIWDRGVRWPRRWLAISNRGLRGFNCKLVVTKRSWWAEFASTLAFFLTYGLFSSTAGSSYRYVEPAVLREAEKELNITSGHPPLPILVVADEERGGHEEDLAPGGDYVKLLLLAKPFSPTFRENWELYRTEYWERENERRGLIREKLQERDRRLAKQHGGWFWWLPWQQQAVVNRVLEKHYPGQQHSQMAKPQHPAVESQKRHRSNSVRRSSVTSVASSSSRTTTPTVELEDPGQVGRKTSTASNASEKRRGKKLSTSGQRPARQSTSRSVTPDYSSPLAKESSVNSSSSSSNNNNNNNGNERPSGGGRKATRSQSPEAGRRASGRE